MIAHPASAEAGPVRDVIREDGFVMTDCRASAGWMGRLTFMSTMKRSMCSRAR